MNIHSASLILPVLAVLILGKVLSSKNILSKETFTGIRKLISDVLLPVVLFNAMLTADLSGWNLATGLIIFAVFSAEFAILLYISRKRKKNNTYALLIPGYEGGMFGYPLYISLFGSGMLSTFIVVDVGNILFAFIFFIPYLIAVSSGLSDKRQIIRKIILSPLVILVTAGIILNVSGAAGLFLSTEAAEIYTQTESMIATPISALILLCVGSDLKFEKSNIKPVIINAFLHIAAVAAAACTVMLIRPDVFTSKPLLFALILCIFLPPQFVTSAYVKDADDRKIVSAQLSVNSVITVAAFAVISLFV
jgi:predicted permease